MKPASQARARGRGHGAGEGEGEGAPGKGMRGKEYGRVRGHCCPAALRANDADASGRWCPSALALCRKVGVGRCAEMVMEAAGWKAEGRGVVIVLESTA